MPVTGIICEYNPLHLGHKKQLDMIRSRDPQGIIVCLMSGNFVQRGQPAIVDKMTRAKAAILAGADLVLELPVTAALSSAEGFAAEGVRILSGFCTHLCFGAESGTEETLMQTARALLSEEFSALLKTHLQSGISFPAARQAALEEMGVSARLLCSPNDILATEYCKAILSTGTSMRPLPIVREGSYHADVQDAENPSATSLRKLILAGQSWEGFVPEECRAVFKSAPIHTLEAAERAVLARLRTMTEAEFEALPYGSEGLWRKFMHESRREATLSAITAATKSKRYTATRIDRMLLCAFLGITAELLNTPAPYVRTMALNDRGRSVLKLARQHIRCINAGESDDHPYFDLERRCADLYGLFCMDRPEAPGAEEKQRIYYHQENP